MRIELSEFHTMVQDALGRPALNTRVPRRVEMAVAWLERNYTFQYMRTWKTVSVDSAADYPHIISLYDLDVKGIDLVRIRELDDTGEGYTFRRPMLKVKPADRETRAVGTPESYCVNGRNSIVLNSIPDEDLTLEIHLQQFTKWGSGDNWTHWLLDNATQLLLCRTLLLMATGPAKDADLYQMYKTDFDLEISTFNVSEEEIQTEEFVQVWEPPEHPGDNTNLRSG